MRIIDLHISDELRIKSKLGEHGSCSYILYSDELCNLLHRRFGRHNLCLKVFKSEATDITSHTWHPRKSQLLLDCTKIQNLFALRGLAPFVYDIALVNDHNWAQVTDYVRGVPPPTSSASYVDVRKEFSITVNWDMNEKNWVDGWLVDFGSFYWKDKGRAKYMEDMKERINKYASWGSNPLPYQSAFSLPSQRDMTHRVEKMKLDDVDFTGKTVLDLGCSLGLFCQDALARGAKRAVGIERRAEATDIAYEVANWHGWWNLDFLCLKLPRERGRIAEITGLDKFDVTYALSVDRQIGYNASMAEMCDDAFYLEGHVPDKEHTYRKRLEEDFSTVEFLGVTRDHGPRPLFRCGK